MQYNEDEHLLTHNTFGDRFEVWADGDRVVITDLDGDELFTTFHKMLDVEQAHELLVRALANEVLHLERKVELLKEEITELDQNYNPD